MILDWLLLHSAIFHQSVPAQLASKLERKEEREEEGRGILKNMSANHYQRDKGGGGGVGQAVPLMRLSLKKGT